MIVEETKGAIIITPQARAIYNKILEANKHSLEQYAKIADEIEDLIKRIAVLDVQITTCSGKIKTHKISGNLSKAGIALSNVRWELDVMKMRDYPEQK